MWPSAVVDLQVRWAPKGRGVILVSNHGMQALSGEPPSFFLASTSGQELIDFPMALGASGIMRTNGLNACPFCQPRVLGLTGELGAVMLETLVREK